LGYGGGFGGKGEEGETVGALAFSSGPISGAVVKAWCYLKAENCVVIDWC
jgi:hypothetical protein